MKRIYLRILAISWVLVLGCTSLFAQATAQISGTVKDQSGAVLPGVGGPRILQFALKYAF